MKTKQITLDQYEDCNECPFCEFPDEKGEIKIPGNVTLRLSKTVLKEGKHVPNPIVARCGVDGKRLTKLNGCSRWFFERTTIVTFR